MFRKSVFIMLFVCLLAPVAMAAYPWDGQLEWRSTLTDANWYEAGNWSNEGTPVCPTDGSGPGPDNYCAVLPNQPGPRITGNSTCSMLSLNPWDPTSWGGQDCNVIVDACALDVNCGAAIQLNSQVDYDSYLGGPTLVSRAILNVYGGTVRTPNQNGNGGNVNGITIGGGSSNFGMAYGMLNIYGGLVNVPRVVLNFGEIGLYGGTLQVNTDGNFAVSSTNPGAALNKVRIDGGTLILAGDHSTDVNTLTTSGYIVCDRGTLRLPTYDGTWTTLIADINYCVWLPTPANGATNVRYKVNPYDPNDPCSITLMWSESTLTNIDANDDIYFGTSSAAVNTATRTADPCGYYMGSRNDDNNDPCSFTIKEPNTFKIGTVYYWRVDENSVSNGFKKGLVWKFTTHNGQAFNPKPVNDANTRGLNANLLLSWTPGDWTDGTNGHKVYFSTSSGLAIRPTDKQYRGQQDSNTYSLTKLAGDWTIVPGTTYYWAVDEVVNGVVTYKGPVWSFTPAAYLNIDDFEDSQSTDDVNANWPDGYTLTGCTNCDVGCGSKGYAGRLLIRDSSGKYMQYSYDNDGTHAFSEAKHPYSGSGTSFIGGGVISPAPKALRIDYKGTATNTANMPNSNNPDDSCDMDRMYVAIEDATGHVSMYLNPDPYAQQVGNWTSWYVSLYDINAWGNANLNAITGFAIGFGERCINKVNGFDGVDANSIVMFDNIRLYAATCVPGKGPTADLDGDCDVDLNDLDLLATDWLQHASNLVFSPCTVPHKAPILWYKFNESGQAQPADSGTGDANNYTGTINAFIASNWKVGGGRDGNNCLYLPPGAGCYVLAPVATPPGNALGFMGDASHSTTGGGGISFSVWIKADETSNFMKTSWNGIFGVWDACTTTETLEVHCPSPLPPTDSVGPRTDFIKRSPAATAAAYNLHIADYGEKWNHWAFTKSDNSMKVYHNGVLLGETDANGLPGDPNVNVTGPLFSPAVGSFRIGTRGGNWGLWNGYIQDFQTYDYCLSDAEVAWLATDGTGHIFIPLVSPANINTDGAASPATDVNQIVNFGDLAIMGKQWHTTILWP